MDKTKEAYGKVCAILSGCEASAKLLLLRTARLQDFEGRI